MRYLTEVILWNQVREGDESAFEELFNLYADMLLAYGLRFTHDRELVKDIIQDLFVKIIRGHASLPDVDSVQAYLLQAFRNSLISSISRNRFCSFDEDNALRQQVEDNIIDSGADGAPDDDMLLRRARVSHALSRLTNHQKEVLYLRYVQNLSSTDIARLLCINVQSVRNDVHRVLTSLRTQLKASTTKG